MDGNTRYVGDIMDELISIIVPIYNAESSLEKCIFSIVEQTYKNMQIILVNDGSTDSSLNICETFKKKDSRIEIVTKQNGGIVSARKIGVMYARGEFVGWVDADDWVEKDYFEHLVDRQRLFDVDIVVADHYHEIDGESTRISNNFSYGNYRPEELIDNMIYSGEFFTFGIQPHLYNKLFRRELLIQAQKNLNDRICAGDDAAVTYPCLLNAEKINICDICGYHYIQHQGSITKLFREDEYERMLLVKKAIQTASDRKGYKIENQLDKYIKYFMLSRSIEFLDKEIDKSKNCLYPYGEISRYSKVVIYGAGVLGQIIYKYLKNIETINIVNWVDQNYEYYKRQGFSVNHPNVLCNMENYDYIIVANTVHHVADSIIKYLTGMGIDEKYIRWLSEDFIK